MARLSHRHLEDLYVAEAPAYEVLRILDERSSVELDESNFLSEWLAKKLLERGDPVVDVALARVCDHHLAEDLLCRWAERNPASAMFLWKHAEGGGEATISSIDVDEALGTALVSNRNAIGPTWSPAAWLGRIAP